MKINNSRDTLGSVVQGLFRLFPAKTMMLSQWCSVSRRFAFPGEPDFLYLYHILSFRRCNKKHLAVKSNLAHLSEVISLDCRCVSQYVVRGFPREAYCSERLRWKMLDRRPLWRLAMPSPV